MFYRTIFVCLVGLVLVNLVKIEPLEITFNVQTKKVNDVNHINCDHTEDNKYKNKYTVLEGEEFKIITKNTFVNNFIISWIVNNSYREIEKSPETSYCQDYGDENVLYNYSNYDSVLKSETTFRAEKRMGTLWKCMILTHQNVGIIHPVVQYENNNYSAAYCYMKIHVRKKKSPQTILVNNMVLQAVCTDLSEKDIDFTAEYQYADGDEVNVTCDNFVKSAPLKMEYYAMGDKLNDKFSSANLTSLKKIGFITKLHSGHNNTHMICTNTEKDDYTKVMVRFVMRTKLNKINISINGMTLRPKLINVEGNDYIVEYKYVKGQPVTVMCEVEGTDLKLVVNDRDLSRSVSSYKRKELIHKRKTEMSFDGIFIRSSDNKLWCSIDCISDGKGVERIEISFTESPDIIDEYPLQIELPSNSTEMIFYNNEVKVIFYEFEVDETLNLTCNPLFPQNERDLVTYLQFKDSEENKENGAITKPLHLTRKYDNSKIVCYLKEKISDEPEVFSEDDRVLREIRVILHEKVLTTTTTTTTTTTVAPENTESGVPASLDTNSKVEGGEELSIQTVAGIAAGVVVCIVIICISIVIIKLRKRNHSQGRPRDPNYENLPSPSEASIPAYPPQWESNYHVPVDRRTDDTTYSEPFRAEPVLYSTAVPKNHRNKKLDSTYAVLDVKKEGGRRNTFKETDDPNYSELYVNSKEQCYAQVLPKNKRNKIEQDINPYSYVTSEPPYVNAVEPEPMYCEPNTAPKPGGQYANVNNKHYVNSPAQEYVEPTYCELQKRIK